jgi:hypothetical protein
MLIKILIEKFEQLIFVNLKKNAVRLHGKNLKIFSPHSPKVRIIEWTLRHQIKNKLFGTL